MKHMDLTGKKFNRLVVVDFSHKDKNNHKCWKCVCSCGKIVFPITSSLKSGHVKSCGCLSNEWKHRNKTTHGMTNTRFYRIWKGMIYRCINKNNNNYKKYGMIGIKVYDRWHKFENFKNDMLENYKKHVEKFGEKDTSIDRIDTNDNYRLDNCRWATNKEQANNKNNNKFITYSRKNMIIQQQS